LSFPLIKDLSRTHTEAVVEVEGQDPHYADLVIAADGPDSKSFYLPPPFFSPVFSFFSISLDHSVRRIVSGLDSIPHKARGVTVITLPDMTHHCGLRFSMVTPLE
jgi:hypothetical protein